MTLLVVGASAKFWKGFPLLQERVTPPPCPGGSSSCRDLHHARLVHHKLALLSTKCQSGKSECTVNVCNAKGRNSNYCPPIQTLLFQLMPTMPSPGMAPSAPCVFRLSIVQSLCVVLSVALQAHDHSLTVHQHQVHRHTPYQVQESHCIAGSVEE